MKFLTGLDCEIFVNLGPDAAAWVFLGCAATATLRGLAGVFGHGYIRIRLGITRLYSGPIWGLQGTKEKPRFSAGRGGFGLFVALYFLVSGLFCKVTPNGLFSVAGGLFACRASKNGVNQHESMGGIFACNAADCNG